MEDYVRVRVMEIRMMDLLYYFVLNITIHHV